MEYTFTSNHNNQFSLSVTFTRMGEKEQQDKQEKMFGNENLWDVVSFVNSNNSHDNIVKVVVIVAIDDDNEIN